jgi:obg-like ATPase 1
LERLEREIQEQETKISRAGHNASKEQRFELETLKKVKGFLEETRKPIRSGDWSNSEIEVLNRYLFLTAKPQVYLVNLSEKDYIRKKNKWLPKIKEWVDARTGEMIIPFSADLESKLLNLESQSGPGAVQEYLNENKVVVRISMHIY